MANEDETYHIPVLCERTVELLFTRTNGAYVDGTLGGGGHSAFLLSRLDHDGRVFGIDQDAEAIEFSKHRFRNDERMTVVKDNVVHLRSIIHAYHIDHLDGILLDLGMSSRQIDRAERGFSFQQDGPLDMRMDTAASTTAAGLLKHSSREDLVRMFRVYGEERFSGRIVDAIIDARQRDEIRWTHQLRDIVATRVSGAHTNKTLARIFQALRIAVNDEMNILERLLEDAYACLAPGGRMVILSYHSLEDRMVKLFLRAKAATCVCPRGIPVCVCGTKQKMKVVTQKSIRPDEDEIRRNPRARSARLRAGEKIHP